MTASSPNLANFVIAGSARSGTTALALALASHPEIFFTTPKETHFFSHVGAPVEYAGPGDDLLINDVAVTDPDEFGSLFANADGQRRRGEGSVSSLYYYEQAIPAIEHYAASDTHVLLLLREPHARMVSGYSYMRSRGHEPASSISEALSLEAERRDAGWCHMWAYEGVSKYGPQVSAFHDAFGDRLHIAVYEQFRRDPAGELRSMCEFLDVDPTYVFDDLPETNRGGEPRSALITSAMNSLRSSEAASSLVRRAVPLKAREAIRRATLRTGNDTSSGVEDLGVDFSADVSVVESIIGHKIEEWR